MLILVLNFNFTEIRPNFTEFRPLFKEFFYYFTSHGYLIPIADLHDQDFFNLPDEKIFM